MMNDSRRARQPGPGDGLCPVCANVHVITNDRGSRFFLCRLSAADPRFPRYPPQPIVQCAGHRPRATENTENTEGTKNT
jgi:hypothetical protein